MKVGVKLVIGFMTIAFLAAAIGVVGVLKMRAIDGLAESMYNRHVLGLAYSMDASRDLLYAARAEENILHAQSREQQQTYRKQYEESLKLLDDNLGNAKRLTLSEEGKKIVANLLPSVKDWKDASQNIVDTALSEPLASAPQSNALSVSVEHDKLKTADDLMTDLVTLKKKNARGLLDTIGKTFQTSLVVMICLVIGGVILGLAIGTILSSGVTRQLGSEPSEMMEIANKISRGDLTIGLESRRGKKAIGAFASLMEMKDELLTMVSTILDSSAQVASSSEEIAASALNLSESAQSQASTLEQTSASVEELSASVDQVAEHARSQSAAMQESSKSVTSIYSSVEQASRSLEEIGSMANRSVENAVEGSKAVTGSVGGMKLIADGSEKIRGIVAVISDIADQTNLLALNASIEAARAGENGRGFAVVAQEVSKLADRSSVSTREIEGLIKESDRNVAKGVESASASERAMEQIRTTSERVKEMIVLLSASMTQQVGTIRELLEAVKNVSDMSRGISAATEEQATNAKQVSKAVEAVNETTQTTASSAEEMSASTEQLSHIAQQLQLLVSRFQVAELPGSSNAVQAPTGS